MKVFASALGQVDNVGDTALRRAFLDTVRQAGQLQVFVGSRSDGYLSGLGLHDSDTLHRSSDRWRSALSRSVAQGPIIHAFNAGEMELERAYAMRYLRLAPLLAANRVRGGHAVHAGFGIRTPTRWRVPIASVLRVCDIVSWRDAASRQAMGVGGVAPDWAFGLGASDEELLSAGSADNRSSIAVAIRYNDLVPDDTWVSNLRSLADDLGAGITVAAQIRRDGPLAEQLADRLGGDALTWESDDHAAQEARLRDLYRRSSVLVTDRLHGAVMAVTEGAVPLALGRAPGSKVTRTLGAVGIAGVAVNRRLPDAAHLIGTAHEVLGRRAAIMRHVAQARADLAELRERIRLLA